IRRATSPDLVGHDDVSRNAPIPSGHPPEFEHVLLLAATGGIRRKTDRDRSPCRGDVERRQRYPRRHIAVQAHYAGTGKSAESIELRGDEAWSAGSVWTLERVGARQGAHDVEPISMLDVGVGAERVAESMGVPHLVEDERGMPGRESEDDV